MLIINRSFVEYIYKYVCVVNGIIARLHTLFGLETDTECLDFLRTLATKEEFKEEFLPEISADGMPTDEARIPPLEALKKYVSEWKNTSLPTRQSVETVLVDRFVNTLSDMLGLQLYVKCPDDFWVILDALAKTADEKGMIYVMANKIVTFHRTLLAWDKYKLYKGNWPMVFKKLEAEKKTITWMSRFVSFFEEYDFKKAYTVVDRFERLFSKDITTHRMGRLLQLFNGRGFVFNEQNPQDRIFALQWFRSIHDYARAFEEEQEGILRQIKLSDPFDIENQYQMNLLLSQTETQQAIDKFTTDHNSDEKTTNDNTGKGSKTGESHTAGTWHTPSNTTSDLIWSDRFDKAWDRLHNRILEEVTFPSDLRGKKHEQAVSMLEAGLLYKELELKGFARPFSEHGTTSSFLKTLPERAVIYRQGMGDYVLLIDVVIRMMEIVDERRFYETMHRLQNENNTSSEKNATNASINGRKIGPKSTWKKDKKTSLLAIQDAQDMVLELQKQSPKMAAILSAKRENYEHIFDLMEEIGEKSWFKH